MKKMKIASMKSDLPRTPKEAMAPAKYEKTEDDMLRDGEYDMDHLMKAEDIKGDAKRMEYVHKAHAKKTTQMRSIADLKMASQALAHQTTEEAKAKAAQPRIKARYPKREA